MKERLTPKDDIEIYNAFSNENTDKTDLLKWALCGKDYEDLEEQGLIVRLPCKVGDKFWYISCKLEIIAEAVFELSTNGKFWGIYDSMSNLHLIKNIFFTYAEAEKKLKELKGEEC